MYTKGIICEKTVLADPGSAAADGVRPRKRPGSLHPGDGEFSNEFEFDPLRGPVKDFSQTLLDEHDVVVKKVSAQLSKEGCFDLLTLEDVENNTGATLLLDANYYVDGRTHEKRLRLQGNVSWRRCPPPA